MQHKSPQGRRHGASLPYRAWSLPVGPIALGLAVGIGYFLAARLSLSLITPADGVAAFWPAAGIASGILIALGSKARLPVAAGVMAATVAVNLLGDRNLASSIVFAFINAGEALCAAWLIRRRFGSEFSLDSVDQVLDFFAATAVAAAASAAAALAGIVLFHNLGAPALTIWFNWFASDALGSITVAPLVVGLVRAARDIPKTGELLEGTILLASPPQVSLLLVPRRTTGSALPLWV